MAKFHSQYEEMTNIQNVVDFKRAEALWYDFCRYYEDYYNIDKRNEFEAALEDAEEKNRFTAYQLALIYDYVCHIKGWAKLLIK